MPSRRYYAGVDATSGAPSAAEGGSAAEERPGNQFRRSISIFSRRGTDTPEPTPPFIAQAMRRPKLMSQRQKIWVGRRRSVQVHSTSPRTRKSAAPSKKRKGTVLNAVPQARRITMTSLEAEMATSPNEEILSAISERAPTLKPTGWDPHSPAEDVLKSRSTAAVAQRAQSLGRHETESRIGVWVNGVVQWDQAMLSKQEETVADTGFTPIRPMSGATQLGHQLAAGKPHLSVVIPAGEHLADQLTLPAILQPRPRRAVVPVAPASIISKYAATTPAIVLDEARSVSPRGQDPAASQPTRSARQGIMIPLESDRRPRDSRSSTSSSSVCTEDASSNSRRSSATSVEALEVSAAPTTGEKALPPIPPPTPDRASPPPRADRKVKALTLQVDSQVSRVSSIQCSRLVSELDRCDRDFMRSAPDACKGTLYAMHRYDVGVASPTLSEAEDELQNELSGDSPTAEHTDSSSLDVTVDGAMQSTEDTLKRNDSVREVMHPPVRAPTIPKRSRKRDWLESWKVRTGGNVAALRLPTRRRSEVEVRHCASPAIAPTIRKSASVSYSSRNSADLSSTSDITFDAVPKHQHRMSLTVITNQHLDPHELEASYSQAPSPIDEVPSTSAEHVLLHILASLKTLDDLFNTAIINKGMYRVYKENEMDLLRLVAFNQSPAAWEFREWCPPDRNIHGTDSSGASSQLEHSPLTYMRCYRRDMEVIEKLKGLILQKCQTFIRRETAFALSTPLHPNATRFNDAFWRIWTFCQVFGSNKGREDDITGQLDWLKGGLLANNQGCVATVNTNLDFDMSSVLLNPPEHFAQANLGGLYASQLYDMTELWTCLMVLLHGYSGRVEQARLYGVFDGCDVVSGDVESETLVLEEWLAYLMTLGPAVVLEMAEWADHSYPAGFELAKESGWTSWTPPVYSGSRSSFLKEPVAKTYEEQVALAKRSMQDPIEQEKKERSRQRVASLAAEIRLARQSSDYKRLPLIDMSSERPMSQYSRQGSLASNCSHPRHGSTDRRVAPPLPPAIAKSLPSVPPSPMSSRSLWASPRRIVPISEGRVERFNCASLSNFGGISENTSDAAVSRIVELGFTAEQARHALRMTDMGDGIRLDRAVELLLRQA